MIYCIDTDAEGSWTSYCGKYKNVDISKYVMQLITLEEYLDYYRHEEDTRLCRSCLENPELTLLIVDNLEI